MMVAGGNAEIKARLQVVERSLMLAHVGAYTVVNSFLVAVWARTSRRYPWFLWVLVGWGSGLALHFVAYSTSGSVARDRIREKKAGKTV
jgi:hypothetical protein